MYTAKCKIDSQGEAARELNWVLSDEPGGGMGGWEGKEGVQKEGDICIHIADSLHCIAESNTAL